MKRKSLKYKHFFTRMFTMLLIACMLLGSFPAQQVFAETTGIQMPNLLANSGFEDGLKSWTIRPGFLPGEVDSSVYCSGGKSLKMTLSDSTKRVIYDQLVPVNGGTTYSFKAYSKTENWAGAGGKAPSGDVQIYFYSAAGLVGYIAPVISMKVSAGTTDWQLYEMTVAAPVNAKFARISPYIMSGTGTVWFDDISFSKVVGPNDLAFVNLTADKTSLEAGEKTQLRVSGTLGSGSAADLSGAVITYSSDKAGVATVGSNGEVRTIGAGVANLKVSVTLNGQTEQAVVQISVTGEIQAFDFNFKTGISSTISANGWAIKESNTTYRDQPYGVHVQSDAVGKYITLSINVPVGGYFTPLFTGAGSDGGGIADLMLDGIYVGQIDFYTAQYIAAQPGILLKTLQLSAGIHTFTLKAVGKSKSWGYNMYPSELKLLRQASLPVLEAVEASCSLQDLAVGQSTKICAAGIMSNGYKDALKGSDAVKTFSSSDAAVAAVDENGAIRALKAGTAQISVKVVMNGVTKETVIPITVNTKVLKAVEIALEKNNISVGFNTSVTVSATFDDGSKVNLSDANVVYSSDNEAVAAVTTTGQVISLSEGAANIKAEVALGNTTASAITCLNVIKIKLDSISVACNKSKLLIGRQASITVTGKLNNGLDAVLTSSAITFTSSEPSVIEVNPVSGVVTAKAAGTAQITVSVTLEEVTKTDNSISIVVENPGTVTSSKTKTTYYTPEKIAAARENIEKYDWAKAARDGAIEKANTYVDQQEFLWNIVSPQSIPRGILVNAAYNCPDCGTDLRAKYGNYPWLMDPVNDPWKVTCPECKKRFPSNDFGAYYKSGLDAHGIFDASKADKALLVNTLYPEKGEKWGVDDGFGFIGTDNKPNTFIAYYAHWGIWYSSGTIQNALDALRDAYIYTGDIKYARTGTILLDRIADVYPAMSLDPYGAFLNSHGGTGKGKVTGSIWETGLVQSFIKAYDAFYPAMGDPELIGFLTNKSTQYDLDNPKSTAALICKNIEDGIIRQVYPAVKNAEIRGNFGMHQAALALAAVVLDSNPDTSEWLDFTFKAGSFLSNPYRVTGGDIMATLVDKVDRDGHGNEAAPGYNALWLAQLKEVADALDGYEGYPGADLYKNTKFMKMFSAMYPVMLCERYMAQIGDSGGTGNPGLIMSIADSVAGFIKFGDPVLGQLAYFLNNNSAKDLHASIFTRNPESVNADIQRIISEKGKLNLKSNNLAGYGFAALRDGINNKQFFGHQIAFQNLSPIDATAGFKFYANSGTIQFEADKPGQHVSFKFMVPKTDVYEVDINPFKSTSYGIYDIAIDGVKAATVDFYGGSGANSKLEVIKKLELSAGEHTITFEGVGKNDTSLGYKMGLIHIVLFDTEALKIKEDNNRIDTQRDFWMYYGRSDTSHAHRDQLNLGIHAYGLDLSPELGYPEETGDQPNRVEWVSNTVSHNTVVVDKSKQRDTYDGNPVYFDDSNMVKLMEVDSKAYENTQMYKRTLAMIKVSEDISYGVDFFRVKGGNDHYYSFHGAEGAVATEGLSLTAQATGTYAGPDVEFGKRADSVAGWGYMGSGFHWLKNVEKDENPGAAYSADWDIVDGRGVLTDPLDIHLRLTMLGDVDDVAIMDGQPPKKPGNPTWLKYLIAHRKGENLNSLFTAVIEPYKDTRYIKTISEVPVTVDGQETKLDVKAVRVELLNGRIDYIISTLDTEKTYTVDGKFTFKGSFGVYSEKDGKQVYGYVCDGSFIGKVRGASTVTGAIESFTKDLNNVNEIVATLNNVSDAQLLAGRQINIKNDGLRNASYRIKAATKLADGRYKLDIGDTTLIRSYVDSYDLSKGYVYNIGEGQQLTIPLSTENTSIDNAAPEYSLTAGGKEITEGAAFDDSKLLTFSSKDQMSELAAASVTVDGVKYATSINGQKVEIKLAGKLGKHTAAVYTEDMWGNSLTKELHFNVTTSIASMKELVSRYNKSGELSSIILTKLLELNLNLAQIQINKGKYKIATVHLKTFTTLLNSKLWSNYVKPAAKTALNADAAYLINEWSKKK